MHEPQITLYTALIISFLILAVIIFLFVASMVRQHKKRIELYKAKLAAEISTLENERKRISADLHDDLGPLLSVIKFKLNDMEVLPGNEMSLQETEQNIDLVVKKLRQISNDLMPATLLRKGLLYAVEEFSTNINSIGKINISFGYSDLPPLSDRIAINVYRIIFEIVHNALKHSEANGLEINLYIAGHELIVETSDDGKGFDVHGENDKHGHGLLNIVNRTEFLSGQFFVESAPGEGTSYKIQIPLKETDESK